MRARLSEKLGDLLLIAIACVLAIGFFTAFVAPGVPRTAWGWAMALVLGLPLLIFVDVVFDLFLGIGVTRRRRSRPRRGGTFVRWAAAFVICALVLTAVNLVLANVHFLDAQFR